MYLGDCRELIPTLTAGSVDAVITDPPYGGANNLSGCLKSSKKKYVSSGASYHSTLPDIDGESLFPEAWRELINEVFRECARVLKPGGQFLAFIDWRNAYAFHAAAQAANLTPRGMLVWDKGRSSRPYKNGFRRQAEFIYWATKGAIPVGESPVYLYGVFNHTAIANGKRHILEKPVPLIKEMVPVVPEGVILDPFSGAGSTGIAALQLGRRFIGCESVPEYFETACLRLAEAEND